MNKVQENLLEIITEIDRICRKHDIMYFLDSGTELGAVRHQGFIPWDDDADIGMLRSDYERFIKIAQEEFGDEFFLQTTDTEPNYFLMYAKVRKNGTKFVEAATKNIKMHQGVFVDIFPFDCIPNKNAVEEFRRICKVRYELYEWGVPDLVSMPQKNIGFILRSIARRIKYHISRLKSRDKIINKIYREFTQYNSVDDDNMLVTSFAYGSGKDYLYPANIFDEVMDVCFENHSFKILKEYDAYLRITYGDDYMELPPESERIRHNMVDVDV